MSDSLFDDESIPFFILRNAEHQYSIWPAVLDLPSGWEPVQGPSSRQTCLDWLNRNWTDLRPQTLRSTHPEGVS